MSISPVGKVSSKPVRLFNRCLIPERHSEPIFQVRDHYLLLEFISQHELFTCSTNISISVVHSKGGVSGLINLDSHMIS